MSLKIEAETPVQEGQRGMQEVERELRYRREDGAKDARVVKGESREMECLEDVDRVSVRKVSATFATHASNSDITSFLSPLELPSL